MDGHPARTIDRPKNSTPSVQSNLQRRSASDNIDHSVKEATAYIRYINAYHLPLSAVGSNPIGVSKYLIWWSYPGALQKVGGSTRVNVRACVIDLDFRIKI